MHVTQLTFLTFRPFQAPKGHAVFSLLYIVDTMGKKNNASGFRPKASPIKYNRVSPTTTPPTPNGGAKSSPRLMPILIGGGLLYITATYVSMSVFKSKSDTTTGRTHDHSSHDTPVDGNFDTAPVWEKIAKNYDKEIDWDEFVMGIGLMRRWLIGQAKVYTYIILPLPVLY